MNQENQKFLKGVVIKDDRIITHGKLYYFCHLEFYFISFSFEYHATA